MNFDDWEIFIKVLGSVAVVEAVGMVQIGEGPETDSAVFELMCKEGQL